MKKPKEWINPYQLIVGEGSEEIFDKHYAYEAGADAAFASMIKPPSLIEMMGNAVIIACGIFLLVIFVQIEILGYYGVEENAVMRWVEILLGPVAIALGINRHFNDIKKRRE